MEMGDDQYGLSEHRRFLARRTHFPANSQPSDPYFSHTHRNIPSLPSYHHEEAAAATFMVGNGMAIPNSLVRFGHDHNFTASATAISASSPSGASASASASLFGVDMENGGWSYAANSRWPRQETLTLLEIRSKLDSKFKEANQKGPLWDEVSRLMAEEHGYQRSGKKCREKFENLHKYYKKTKEGKAGRQDGRNYRFFRQLEALYGEATTNQSSLSETQTTLFRQPPNTKAMNQENNEEKLMMSESLSFSNASEFDTSSSENNDDQDLSAIAFMMNQSMAEKQKNPNERGSSKKGWKAKVKDFVESQMKELMDSQDAWMERTMKKIEEKEQERMSQMEEWRRQESVRFDKEHQFWAKERAWAEARDVALMEFLNKCTETHSLLEEIEAKMYFNKKSKEDFCSNYNNNNYFQQIDSCEAQENNINNDHNIVRERDSHSPSNSYVGTQQLLDTNSFQIGVNAGDQSLWDRCGLNLKLSKGKNKQI